MSDDQAVLFANEAFYRAFADGDPGAMDDVWARNAPVACIHPGWAALSGRENVMESWRAILTGANRPAIESLAATAFVYGDAAFVICYESLDEVLLIATNIFVREEGAWKMVHHQAGPSAPPVVEEPDDEPATVVH